MEKCPFLDSECKEKECAIYDDFNNVCGLHPTENSDSETVSSNISGSYCPICRGKCQVFCIFHVGEYENAHCAVLDFLTKESSDKPTPLTDTITK